MKRRIINILMVLMLIFSTFSGCSVVDEVAKNVNESTTSITSVSTNSFSLDNIPEYDSNAYVIINNNIPDFSKSDITITSYETYGKLDNLGRCTSCMACVGTDIMPTEERGAIGSIKPTGWHTIKYDNVDGKYLYNRCHLIGYQLTAENANEQNLITGTRYLNVDGMLDFENEVANYIRQTNNHVLYRVTPIFNDAELLARGVQMEAYSVEDKGDGVCFNVYCYNVQPDIEINYQTGESKYVGNSVTSSSQGEKQDYVVNINTKKFHKKSCKALANAKKQNIKNYTGYSENLINNGYEPCGVCKP